MRYIIAAFFCLLATVAQAQNPVITKPFGTTNNNQSSTISVTNTFQQIFPASTGNTGRTACTIQNNGTNSMWVYFGPIVNADKGHSVVVAPGLPVYCNSFDIILRDQVSITGTSGDAFYAAQQ